MHGFKKKTDESYAEILALLMSFSRNVKDVMGIVHSLRDEIETNHRGLVKLKEEMSSKMDEGFKKEQHARQQIQSEIVQGFNNEGNARQLVQKELVVMKDDFLNLKMGSGSTVCSEASVPLLGQRQSFLDGMKFSFHERWNSKVGGH